MPNVVLPTVIQGPAYISEGGLVTYVKKDIALTDQVESWNPESSFGPLGERHKSRKYGLSYTPVGMLRAASLDRFYAAFKTPSVVGTSAMTGAVVIYSIAENKTYNFAKGGMTKPPSLILKPTGTVYGSMELTCIGDPTLQPTNAAFIKAADGTVSADTSFDETKIISDIYSAAIGARSTPYNGMGGMDGFEVNFNLITNEIPASDVGIADIIIGGVGITVSFAPSNLTEAQVDTLCAIQGASAVLPGQAYAKANEDLVITGTQGTAVFTFKNMGAKKSDRTYQIGEHRHKGLDFVNGRKWTTGVGQALFSYSGVT
jgi:hypothetical protein